MKHIQFLPLLAILPAFAATTPTTRRLEASTKTLQEIMQEGDRTIPQRFLDKSECVVVVPGLKKGAFLVGAKWGRGFVACRNPGGTPGWSAPAAVRVEGGSFGLQAGGQETDVVMLIMNRRGVERLFKTGFTLGGDASVAAGPVGRSAAAETDAMMTAEILTWARTRGAFAGVSVQGATLRPDRSVNKEMYGEQWSTRDIVSSGLPPISAADPFVKLLNRYSSRKSQ